MVRTPKYLANKPRAERFDTGFDAGVTFRYPGRERVDIPAVTENGEHCLIYGMFTEGARAGEYMVLINGFYVSRPRESVSPLAAEPLASLLKGVL